MDTWRNNAAESLTAQSAKKHAAMNRKIYNLFTILFLNTINQLHRSLKSSSSCGRRRLAAGAAEVESQNIDVITLFLTFYFLIVFYALLS